MVTLHKLTSPIAQNMPEEVQESLRGLQGNILRGHGRNHSVHIFLNFKAGKETQVKQWITELAEHITSAQKQLWEAEQYRQNRVPEHLFMSFFLSAKGYKYLGLNFPSHPPFDKKAFPGGMEAAQLRLNDPSKTYWEEGYQKDLHAMVLLADDREDYLQQKKCALLNRVQAHAEPCVVEHGRVIRIEKLPVEHFGYVDSISQPQFFQREDRALEKPNNGELEVWDSAAGPDLVLVPDPYGRKEVDRHGIVRYHHSGSYMVFRKLEQNVFGFKHYEKRLAEALGFTGEGEKRAGALVMGRFENGTPVVLSPTATSGLYRSVDDVPDHFTYKDDPHGQKCPLQAHIRKVNPRDERSKSRRIVRRGITYGKREEHLQDRPTQGVGLLFMCYQKNIEERFEFLQTHWANNSRLPAQEETGIDPIIGQRGQRQTIELGQQRWSAQWDAPRDEHRPFNFYNFVTLKGGEYFFAPSIYFLENLGKEAD
jgi:Dyp-type peroxidase family